ncbi:MAG: low specificity L-threonine aldolase [Spirochaetaceae bacterium]|nr:low specificity L-threonine aldolase [Spirochaetaceae bacterium]
MNKIIDLRSDTITKPTEAMRKAIYTAEVGDDVYREDPSVNKIEEMGARISGKEKSIFVPTGSMGNLLSLYINGGRGNEVLCAHNAHIIHHEIASVAAIAGVLPIGIPTKNGILTASDFSANIKSKGVYDMAGTTLLEVENTIGGAIYPLGNLKEIKELAIKRDLKVHMDGARVFNASIASGISVAKYASYADTITFCLSKGLGAPMGSLLCGNTDFIDRARTIRKMLGSGTRQIGFMAAAGIYALENNVDRLAIDHSRAKQIVNTLNECSYAKVEGKSETNIVFFSVKGFEASEIVEKLKNENILANTEGPYVRLVTNLNLDDSDILEVCERLKKFKIN